MRHYAFMICALTMWLTACGPQEDPESRVQTPPPAAGETAAETSSETRDGLSYSTYCFERVGQIGAGGNQDNPRRGDACSIHGSGAGEATGDGRNNVSIHISAPSLETAGFGSVSFILYRGHGTPKFPTGVQVVDQMKRKDLPTRIVIGSDLSNEVSYFTLTGPDADKLREDNPGIDYPGYEIVSGVLTIDNAVDIPKRDHDVSPPGYELGDQFIEGNLSLSFIPMGSTGEQYGPTTFEFRTEIGWGVIP